MGSTWQINSEDCVSLELDEKNILEVKRTAEGIIVEVWNTDDDCYRFSTYFFDEELIENEK